MRVSAVRQLVAMSVALGMVSWVPPAHAAELPVNPTRLDPVPGQVVNTAPDYLGTVNGHILFTLMTPDTGYELWEATPTGVTLVKDINEGAAGSSVQSIFPAFGGALFAASDAAYGNELWFTDGTASGTRLVKDLTGDVESGAPTGFLSVGSHVVFIGTPLGGGFGYQLWQTDGTSAGTVQRTSHTLGGTDRGVQEAALLPGSETVIYGLSRQGTAPTLWASTGVDATTSISTSYLSGQSLAHFVSAAGAVFYERHAGTGQELWRVSGATATLVKAFVSVTPVLEYKGRLILVGDTADTGSELWSSDGSAAGTTVVKDIVAGAGSGDPYPYDWWWASIGGRLYFNADDGVHGRELWTTDGTAAGTYLLADTLADGGGEWDTLVLRGGRLYFTTFGPMPDQFGSLWSTDPVVPGTAHAVTGAVSSFVEMYRQWAVGDTLYLYGDDGTPTTSGGSRAFNLFSAPFPRSAPTMESKPSVKGARKTIKVSWSAPMFADYGITGYRVRVYTRAIGGRPLKSLIVSESTLSKNVTKLKARKKYWITVTPLASEVVGIESLRVKVKTK